MTPAARLSAAIDVLDRWLAGTPVEQALTNWGRASRFAGSGDRNAVRDLVFDAVRRKRSLAVLGGSETGRGLILGGLRETGQHVEGTFTGIGHAPAGLSGAELAAPRKLTQAEALDCPDWLFDDMRASLGPNFRAVMQALQKRAPVFLRVNIARITVADAIARLAREGIVSKPSQLADTALEVTENARKVAGSSAFSEGLVELQDAASQAVVQAFPLRDGMRVLDYCSGGGGKTLAMAARAKIDLTAHDANPARLRDLPARAARAGANVVLSDTAALAGMTPFDLVLVDVPCSGSGAWRRSPEGKWTLSRDRLDELCRIQAEILDKAAVLVREGGDLAYVTCSMLACENVDQVSKFLVRNHKFILESTCQLTPLNGGDGFFFALFKRSL
jgi:16S rRNA (cytosine967-C5)-methyltransferase